MASSEKRHSSKGQNLCETSEDLEDIRKWIKDKMFIDQRTGENKMNAKAAPQKGRNINNLSETKEMLTDFTEGKNMGKNNLTGQHDSGYRNLQMEKNKISEDNMKAISLWLKQKESIGKTRKHTKAEVKAALMADVFNGMTSEDADAAFEKIAKGKNYVDIEEFQDVLAELASKKNLDVSVLHRQLANTAPEEYLHPKKGWRRTKS